MKQHYHVIENTPGFLPESEPGTYRTRKDAEADALELIRQLRSEGYRVRGNKRDGYYAYRRDDEYDLGRSIRIVPCSCPEGERQLSGDDE